VRRSFTFAVWTAILVTLVVDDFFQIHERVGAQLVRDFDLPAVAGLRPQDLGELLVWAVFAAVLGSALLLAYYTASQEDRRHSRALFGWLCVLAFFAVVIDMVDVIVEPYVSHLVSLALTLTETAGELVGMTLIVLAVCRIALPRSTPGH
jgi:hypothetical protein